MKEEAKKEAFLEGGRVIVLALVSYLLTEGVLTLIVELIFGVRVDATGKAVITGLLTTVLRSIDKYLHELGKPKTGILEEKGLTGF